MSEKYITSFLFTLLFYGFIVTHASEYRFPLDQRLEKKSTKQVTWPQFPNGFYRRDQFYHLRTAVQRNPDLKEKIESQCSFVASTVQFETESRYASMLVGIWKECV